jgi:cob(I)alamin adenosyltransferase
MGFRLSKIYTRTGDSGETGLAGGTRVAKDSARMEAIGEADELNSLLGVVIAGKPPNAIQNLLASIQHELFDLGGDLAMPEHDLVAPTAVTRLENALDEINQHLPPLEEFILPGGHPLAAQCHLARSVCRRLERRLVTLNHNESVNPAVLAYVNRLSDLLFVVARHMSRELGDGDVLWRRADQR